MIDTAIGFLLYVCVVDNDILVVCLLQTIEVERGILADKSLYHLRT